MKRCPFCAQWLQEEAHHCHHCNSAVIDMDGRPIIPSAALPARQTEWLSLTIQILVTIFFTVQFFIEGIAILRVTLGVMIIEISSTIGIVANIILLMLSVTGAILITPPVIRWVKQKFEHV